MSKTPSLVLAFTQCKRKPDPNDPVDNPDQAFLAALLEPAPDGYIK
ncbi:MAG: hypothetical protein MUO54_01640 [Anaerolineales bacterium]|nr:hypothetical protein [Anaerolineales bacterium]